MQEKVQKKYHFPQMRFHSVDII